MPDRGLGKEALRHSYLYFGEEGLSVREEAEALARQLELGKKDAAGPLIDAAFFGTDTKHSISIDEIRRVKEFLAQKPFKSARRTAIIENADRLTVEAQNALLKISEEPPAEALIIMLARREENFLPTILSRFQKVYVKPEKEGEKERLGEREKQAADLAKKFLISPKKARSEIVKAVVSKENEEEADLTGLFLDRLVAELWKDKRKNAHIVREILEEKRIIGDYNLNRRLQLEKISALWYN